jgi:tripartite-type tricarboxylate transporter receptor subunit TctC
MIGLLTGEVQLMFSALGPTMPHVRQGRMRAVAVTTTKRSRLAPELPTVAETVPGFEAEAAIGFFVPKKTPAAVTGLLNREIVQALKGADPQVLTSNAVEVVGGTPDDFAAFIKSEMARMGPVIKSAHFSN